MHYLPSNLLCSSWGKKIKRSLPEKANNRPKYYLTKNKINNFKGSKSQHDWKYELNEHCRMFSHL